MYPLQEQGLPMLKQPVQTMKESPRTPKCPKNPKMPQETPEMNPKNPKQRPPIGGYLTKNPAVARELLARRVESTASSEFSFTCSDIHSYPAQRLGELLGGWGGEGKEAGKGREGKGWGSLLGAA